jgi:FAD/FMN-containing dehydrogenase
LLAAEVVTADGQLLHVDDKSHPDLFWAIRGGGGNFGIATRFKFQLQELDSVYGGMLILPATDDVIAGFIAEAEAAPDELSTIANVMPAPPMPFLPADAHGKLIVFAMLVYAGNADDGERAVAPFRKLATPLADMLKPMSIRDLPGTGRLSSRCRIARCSLTVDHSAAETISTSQSFDWLDGSDPASSVGRSDGSSPSGSDGFCPSPIPHHGEPCGVV